MSRPDGTSGPPPLRIGAVTYLNARPLSFCIRKLAPQARLSYDLPSRLADDLAAARLDVALVPSIEFFRRPGSTVVSDACVSCEGPVRSVRLYGRVAAARIRTLDLDEGSRTSAVLSRVLLKQRYGLEPELRRLPIGAALEDSTADATMLVGDRGMRPPEGEFEFVWDLGEQWYQWTGLPFVFAMWIARPHVDLQKADRLLVAARDRGVACFGEIARAAAPRIGISPQECLSYLRDNLDFHLGEPQRRGLQLFIELAGRQGLAPVGGELAFFDPSVAR